MRASVTQTGARDDSFASAAAGTPAADPATVVSAVYDALAADDQRTLRRLLSPEVEAYAPPALPWGGYYQGVTGFADLMRSKARTLDAAPEPMQWIAAGERVVVVARSRGCCTGSGRALDLPLVHVWTVRGARVVSVECYADAGTLEGTSAAVDDRGGPGEENDDRRT